METRDPKTEVLDEKYNGQGASVLSFRIAKKRTQRFDLYPKTTRTQNHYHTTTSQHHCTTTPQHHYTTTPNTKHHKHTTTTPHHPLPTTSLGTVAGLPAGLLDMYIYRERERERERDGNHQGYEFVKLQGLRI